MSEPVRPFPKGRVAAVTIALAAVLLAVLITMMRNRNEPAREIGPQDAMFQRYMVSDLTSLITSERIYYQRTGHFTTMLDSVGFLRTIGVDQPVVTVADSGFTATVTHPQLPGMTCGVGIGLPNPVRKSAALGEIVCN